MRLAYATASLDYAKWMQTITQAHFLLFAFAPADRSDPGGSLRPRLQFPTPSRRLDARLIPRQRSFHLCHFLSLPLQRLR